MICNKENKLIKCTLLLDLSKACDWVDQYHNILLQNCFTMEEERPKTPCFLLEQQGSMYR